MKMLAELLLVGGTTAGGGRWPGTVRRALTDTRDQAASAHAVGRAKGDIILSHRDTLKNLNAHLHLLWNFPPCSRGVARSVAIGQLLRHPNRRAAHAVPPVLLIWSSYRHFHIRSVHMTLYVAAWRH